MFSLRFKAETNIRKTSDNTTPTATETGLIITHASFVSPR